MSYRLNISVTDTQARVIERALDLFTRLGIGQLEVLAEVLDVLHPKCFPTHRERQLCQDLLQVLKKNLLLQPANGNYGIGHKDVDKDAKTSYDLQKSIQQVLAGVEGHDSWSVWHDGNFLMYGPEPAAKVTCDDAEPGASKNSNAAKHQGF